MTLLEIHKQQQQQQQQEEEHETTQDHGALSPAAATTVPPAALNMRFPIQNPYRPAIQRNIMGLKSQHTVGAIKACKARGGFKRKCRSLIYRRGDGPFIPKLHCKVCLAKSNNKVSKKAHHSKCPKNKNYQKGVIQEATMGSRMSGASNLTVPYSVNLFGGGARATSRTPTSNTTSTLSPIDRIDGPSLGKVLRMELARRLHLLEKSKTLLDPSSSTERSRLKKLVDSRTQGVPVALQLMFDYIEDEVATVRRPRKGEPMSSLTQLQCEALVGRRCFFHDQECFFRFPTDPSPEPLAEYHALEGHEIFMLDLELLNGNKFIYCPECPAKNTKSTLDRGRTNWSKNKNLFPLLRHNGLFSFGSYMNYSCPVCKNVFCAKDSQLLLQLPLHLQRAYPVEPRFALQGFNFHLSRDVTNDLRYSMLTQSSGESTSKGLYRKSREGYQDMVATFMSKASPVVQQQGELKIQFPIKYEDWCRVVPSGDQLREYYRLGEESPATLYGYSHKERYIREIQSVGGSPVEGVQAVAIDHTFRVTKTYRNKNNGRCAFTIKVAGKKGKRTAGVVLVPDTSVDRISHFMTQMLTRRKGMHNVKVIFTDTWPNGEEFWKDVFGADVQGRLGLFHAIKRLMDTLEKCDDFEFWAVLVYDIRTCFYTYDSHDLGCVLDCLKNGTMTADGHKYTDKELIFFKKTPEFNRRFSKYIRKAIYHGAVIKQKLHEVEDKYQYLDDENGKRIWTRLTTKAVEDLLDKVEYISDVPGFEAYRRIEAPKNSAHGLPTYESLRIESTLEKYHHLLAHFGNLGMGSDLADVIILRGTAEDNIRIEHQHLRQADKAVPSRFQEEPEYYDRVQSNMINQLCHSRGFHDVFEHASQPLSNNGEVFLSQYLTQEHERVKKCSDVFDIDRHKCNCPECQGIPFPILVCRQEDQVTTVAPQPTTTIPKTTQRVRTPASQQTKTLPPADLPSQQVESITVPAPSLTLVTLQPQPAAMESRYIFPVQQSQSFTLRRQPVLVSQPPDACFSCMPYYCHDRWVWQYQKEAGSYRLGAPRHSIDCPRRRRVPVVYGPYPPHQPGPFFGGGAFI